MTASDKIGVRIASHLRFRIAVFDAGHLLSDRSGEYDHPGAQRIHYRNSNYALPCGCGR